MEFVFEIETVFSQFWNKNESNDAIRKNILVDVGFSLIPQAMTSQHYGVQYILDHHCVHAFMLWICDIYE